MAENKRPNSLVFNEAILQGFINGTLEPSVDAKVAAFLELRPELLQKITSKSGHGFLKRLREVQQRSAAEAQARVQAEVVSPVSISKPSTSSDSSVPSQLANYPGYKITKELGRGGMGVVYLAKNVQMDRLEVLKVLNERLLDHDGAKERFLREIRAVSKLSHTNIVTSYSILPLDNLMVFAMEYVHGMDLHKYIHKHHGLPVGLACSFAKQLASGLQHAHEKGLVHRDIKPSNVIVYKADGQLQLKILDFGLAKASSEEAAAGLTQDGTMLGTPEYMSPEQTLNAAKADIRADIYSLGCTLYHMLTGKPPFTGTHGAVLMAHAQREATPINLVRPEVPAELAAVVGKMMAKELKKRYQTPAEVGNALTPFVNQHRSATGKSIGEAVATNTVNDLKGPDRDTSVEAPVPELSLDVASRVVESQPSLETSASPAREERAVSWQPTTSKRRKKAKPNFPRWFTPAVIALGAVFSFFALWQIVTFTFRTHNGTIVIEKMPADAEVLVDGQKFEITWNSGKDRAEVSIDAGSHQLRVLNQGNEIHSERVSVKGGNSTIVTLSIAKPPTNPGAIRTTWKHSNGQFRLVTEGAWEEAVNGTTSRFREVSRSRDFIELEGLSDYKIRIRLFRDRADYSTKLKPEFETWYKGTWLSTAPNPGLIAESHAETRNVPLVPSENTSLPLPTNVGSPPTKSLNADTAGEAGSDNEWVSLFNGTDLTGWKPVPPESGGKWTVEQGEIVGRGEDQSHLFTVRDDFTDFHIRAEVKVNATGNSGICFRTKYFGQGRLKGNGYEANIEGDKSIPWQTGSLMHIDAKGQVTDQIVKPGEWFVLEVIVRDNRFIVKVNGAVTADVVDASRTYNRGHIALQQLRPTEVHFRKIEIMEERNKASNMIPADAVKFNNKYYKVFSDAYTWHQARDECQKLGGRLAEVYDEDENQFLCSLVKKASPTLREVWLGATDEQREGDWVWGTGRKLRENARKLIGAFDKWGPKQPNNKGLNEHYLILIMDFQGDPQWAETWSDQPDQALAPHRPGFVCEWDAAVEKAPMDTDTSQGNSNRPTRNAISDPFTVGSIWVDKTNRLTVQNRNGDDFTANFIVGERIERMVSGKIKEGRIEWFAKDVRAIRGNKGNDNFGTLARDSEGDRIDFTWGDVGQNGLVGRGTFVLRLQK